MSDDNESLREAKPKSKRAEPKRARRNYEGELIQLQGRVDMAMRLLGRTKLTTEKGELIDIAMEILEGK